MDREVVMLIDLAEFAKHGALPVTGGTLDQTQSFMTAVRMLWSDMDRMKTELITKD